MKQRLAYLPMAFAAAMFAVGCGKTILESPKGDIGIVFESSNGDTFTSREATYDFGTVFDGQSLTKKIVVRNMGKGTLSLTALKKQNGAPVVIAGEGDEGAVYDVQFDPQTVMGSSESVEFTVTFAPPEAAETIDYVTTLVLSATNTNPDEATATITLKGQGIPGVCELPKSIDFGSVAVDDSAQGGFAIQNPTLISAEAWVGDIDSAAGDEQAFSFGAESNRGDFELAPKTSAPIAVEFRPTERKSYFAFFKARASAQCPEQTVQLMGTGVDQVLSWDPAQLNCGYVTPGVEVTRELTFSNAGPSAAEVTGLTFNGSVEFRVMGASGADLQALSVPAATRDDATELWTPGTAVLTVGCKPVVLGPRQGTLKFQTNLRRQPQGSVKVWAYGGGPDIDIHPSGTLNFGKVAWFSGSPTLVKRNVAVMNVGTAPAVADNDANLHLGDANGVKFTLVPANADTANDEFTVALDQSYDEVKGLEASVGKNLVNLAVSISPRSVGVKQAELTVYSNDPDEPEVKLLLVANVVQLPPCVYSVSPTTLNFGLVTAPRYRDLTFAITNLGGSATDTCLISGLDLRAGSAPEFSLPGGPVETRELGPGEKMDVLVRVWPQSQPASGVTDISGNLDFYVSSDVKPSASVALEAQLASSCLVIAPDDLNYGTVQIGCSSASRTFQIYNTCGNTVTLDSVTLQAGGGQPPGGPNCSGTDPCEEFVITQAPAIPPGGLQLPQNAPPQTFQVKYTPIDVGSDSGAIAVHAIQDGSAVTYVVTLHGNGDNIGLQSDVFTQDAKPKADILLVIDTSGSMCDDQASLAANFSSFIKYAQSANVDYHIAATTTDMTAEAGRFLFGPTHPDKILTPTSINVKTQFEEKVAPGCSGSGIEMDAEPALRALTAPLVNTDNAGFLRNDAALAIVAVSDEADQSLQTPTWYLNQFWNIKGFNRKELFSFNAIDGFSPACKAQVGGGDSGELAFYAAQTSGAIEDICTPDWSKALENLGRIAFGFRTNFYLTSVPDLMQGPIEVWIDDRQVDATDERGATVWTYDSVANAVDFEPIYVPEPGQTLTITYHTTCYP